MLTDWAIHNNNNNDNNNHNFEVQQQEKEKKRAFNSKQLISSHDVVLLGTGGY